MQVLIILCLATTTWGLQQIFRTNLGIALLSAISLNFILMLILYTLGNNSFNLLTILLLSLISTGMVIPYPLILNFKKQRKKYLVSIK